MADYIRREDYCEENCGKENREGYKTCRNCGMLNVPSADVRPVKHGRWIPHCDDLFLFESTVLTKIKAFKCSACGEQVSVHMHSINYCPNCGARMDGNAKKEENDVD